MNALERAYAHSEQLYAIREQIHRNPETGNREFQTAYLVERMLHSLGIETKRVMDTGIVGTLQGDLLVRQPRCVRIWMPCRSWKKPVLLLRP